MTKDQDREPPTERQQQHESTKDVGGDKSEIPMALRQSGSVEYRLRIRYEEVLRVLFDVVRGSPPEDSELDFLWQILDDTGLIREQGEALLATLRERTETETSRSGGELIPTDRFGTIEPLPGNATDVHLLVSSLIDELPPDGLLRFARNELAATVRRLESEHVSHEAVADIIIQVLRTLPVTTKTAQGARRLLGYAFAEDGKSSGYYLTLAMIGDLISRGGAQESELASGMAFHLAVRGVWNLAEEHDPPEFDETSRRLVATNAHNLVATLWRLRDTSVPGPSSTRKEKQEEQRIRDVTRVLQSISAVVSPSPGGDPGWAGQCLAALGAPKHLCDEEHALTTMGVLSRLGDSGRVWTADQHIAVWFPVASAISAPLSGDPEFTASRLFNSGVSLLQLPERNEERVVLTRITMNLLGLRWALARSRNRGWETVADDDALSCTVNLAGAMTDIWRQDQWAEHLVPLSSLIRQVLGVLDRRRPTADRITEDRIRKDRSRLRGSARQLGNLTPVEPESFDAFSALVDEALTRTGSQFPEASPSSTKPVSRTTDPEQLLILDTARIAGQALSALTITGPWELVSDLVDARQDPARYFIDRYRVFIRDDESTGLPGPGPFLASGLVTEGGWEQLRAELLQEPVTMADVLRGL